MIMSKTSLIEETKKSPIERHNKSLDLLQLIEDTKDVDTKNNTVKAYESACNGLKRALVCGNASSAPYVAYLYANGFGCKKDLKKAAIWLEIGAKLADPDSLALKKGYNPRPDDICITNLCDVLNKHHHVFTSEVISIASQYARAIEKSIEQHGGMYTPIDTVIVTACDIRFEHALHPKETILHVIGDEDGSSCCCVMM